MNDRQRAVLSLEAAVLLLMIAVPPYFAIDRESGGRVHTQLGYFARWNPPTPADACGALRERYASLVDCANRPEAYDAGLNTVRLMVNATASLVATVALLYVLRNKRRAART